MRDTAGTPRSPPGKVYVVDDDPVALLLMARVLASAGYDVESVESPLQFLETVRTEAPCCVLLDLKMPQLDGITVVAELARRSAVMPVVFISGKADVRSTIDAMKLGPSDFLCKPVNRAELLRAVRGALERDLAGRQREALCVRFAGLSPQEQRVVHLVAQGLLNKQIAAQVGMSEASVRNYRARATRKLGVSSTPDLVRLIDMVVTRERPR